MVAVRPRERRQNRLLRGRLQRGGGINEPAVEEDPRGCVHRRLAIAQRDIAGAPPRKGATADPRRAPFAAERGAGEGPNFAVRSVRRPPDRQQDPRVPRPHGAGRGDKRPRGRLFGRFG
ncbi:MAG: hypothetical protein AcusKO_08010 [Acuticoccus sp.]